MNTSELWAALTETFHEVFDDDEIEIREETTAADIEDWDSVTHVQLIVGIEERFSIRFKTGELSGLKDVGALVRVIESRIEAR